jgi:hypothetical protein
VVIGNELPHGPVMNSSADRAPCVQARPPPGASSESAAQGFFNMPCVDHFPACFAVQVQAPSSPNSRTPS